MSFVIEYPYRSRFPLDRTVVSMGFFFERDSQGCANLLYRIKPFYGYERSVVYKDCHYFGINTYCKEVDNGAVTEENTFVVSNDWQDKTIVANINFNNFEDFGYVAEYINDFIQDTMIQAQIGRAHV